MRQVAVTGSAGGAGRATVTELRAHGYEVREVDLVGGDPVDLRDHGAAARAIAGVDAVVHLAANPEPDRDPTTGAERFAGNTLAAFNVFWAAVHHGIGRVVWASSETVYGWPFEHVSPVSLPIRESHPLQPQNAYAHSKVLTEELARLLHAQHGTTFVGLRLSNILHTDPDHPASYVHVPGYQDDPMGRGGNAFGYVDAEDAASACRLALEAELEGAHVVTIAAADTIIDRPSRALAAARFPEVPIEDGLGEYETLLAIDEARRLLGWEPRWSWRDRV